VRAASNAVIMPGQLSGEAWQAKMALLALTQARSLDHCSFAGRLSEREL
jgi:hypothetical protein